MEQAAAILAAANARAAALVREGEALRDEARRQGYAEGRDAAAAELTETLAAAAREAAAVRVQAEPAAMRLAARLAAKMAEKIVGRAVELEPDAVDRDRGAGAGGEPGARRSHQAARASRTTARRWSATKRGARCWRDSKAGVELEIVADPAVGARRLRRRDRDGAPGRAARDPARGAGARGRRRGRAVIGSASRGAGEPQVELVDVGEALARLDQVNPLRLAGRVSEVTGLLVRATIPGVRVGELVYIDNAPAALWTARRGAPPPRARRACRPRSSAFAARRWC